MKLFVHRNSRGFTLVELLVTIGIFIIMTALIMARYGTFSSGAILTNLAYDVALTIRSAETYGLSVKKTESNEFVASYGVHFDTSKSKQFTLFADGGIDNSPNGIYDDPTLFPKDYDVKTYFIRQGASIKGICVGTGQTCDGSPHTIVDISFMRPDPEAIICVDSPCITKYDYAEVTVQSRDGSTRIIKVHKNGQISVGL
jgi:type II secretory pathway pseudopilin PulG